MEVCAEAGSLAMENIILNIFYRDDLMRDDSAEMGRKTRMSDATYWKGPDGTSTRRQAIFGAAITFGGLALASAAAFAMPEEEISHDAASIHQEPVFKASRKRVYEALTDPKQFNKIVELSGAIQAMHLADKPVEISSSAGGPFSLFGGYITGRHIELVPNERIVQAWRVGNWDPGVYSIAKFALTDEGTGTKIVFDHAGFPKGDAEHLATGWKANYWEPLAKLLS
jgi:activator of HSP90 ATPase